MDLDHQLEPSFRGDAETASISFEESSGGSDSDESPVLSKHHLEGDIHYDDGLTRKSSFQADTSNTAMAAFVGGNANGYSPETIDANISSTKGAIVNSNLVGMTLSDAGISTSKDTPNLAAKIHEYNASTASSHARRIEVSFSLMMAIYWCLKINFSII